MASIDPSIGERYLQRTVYRARELFAEILDTPSTAAEPLHFKVYRDVRRVPLGGGLPLVLGDARWSFGEGVAHDGAPPGGALSPRDWSTLLFYSYGFSRRDRGPGAVWPDHRWVASARCLFPTELYAWLPAVGPIAPGIYHYDNLHHHLEQLRSGPLLEALANIVGADLDGAVGVLMVSSFYAKNAYKYHGYSYRLCTQEAGMVVGNALMVAATFGLSGHVFYQFADRAAAELLGLDLNEEGVFAIVPLYARSDARAGRVRARSRSLTASVELEPLPPIAREVVRNQGPAYELPEMFLDIASSSWLEQGVEPLPSDGFTTPPCSAVGAELVPVPPELAPREVELAAALRARSSGNVLFNPLRAPLEARAFWDMVRHATAQHVCDSRVADAPLPITLYLAVRDVPELPAGVYRLCEQHRGLHPVALGDVSRPLQGAIGVPNLNLCASAMVLYLVCNYASASRSLGNRALRMLNMECGIVAQRLSVLGAAHGWTVRIHNGYDAAIVERVLGIEGSGLTPFFQLAVARNRHGVQHPLPILF
jgi:SagB-type dehydrogenase family enzyme